MHPFDHHFDSAEPHFARAKKEAQKQFFVEGLNSKFASHVVAKKYEVTNKSGCRSSRLADGTRLQLNEEGRIIQIEYVDGASVRRHDDYVIVRASNASNWFGDAKNWYQLD